MAAIVERTYYAHVDEILRLMKKKGHSLDSLAKAAPVSPVTLGRLLNRNKKKRRPGVMATFKKIADKLGVTPDSLIEGYEADEDRSHAADPSAAAQPAVELAKAFDNLHDTVNLSTLIARVTKVIGNKATIYVIAIS